MKIFEDSYVVGYIYKIWKDDGSGSDKYGDDDDVMIKIMFMMMMMMMYDVYDVWCMIKTMFMMMMYDVW